MQHCFVIIHSWHDTTNQLWKHPAIVRHNHSTLHLRSIHTCTHRLSHSDHNETHFLPSGTRMKNQPCLAAYGSAHCRWRPGAPVKMTATVRCYELVKLHLHLLWLDFRMHVHSMKSVLYHFFKKNHDSLMFSSFCTILCGLPKTVSELHRASSVVRVNSGNCRAYPKSVN